MRTIQMGNGGRGGRAFHYTWDKDLPYCDPLKERCPTSAHSRMILGRTFLGQVPLILGPSSWGAGGVPIPAYDPVGTPPYFGEWGVHVGGGIIGESGRVGPFDSIDEAFQAAAHEAVTHGATELPTNGYAQVRDSRGRGVGPIT